MYIIHITPIVCRYKKQLDDFIKLSIDHAVPTGLGFATSNYLGAQ